jgi:hypothetical protein
LYIQNAKDIRPLVVFIIRVLYRVQCNSENQHYLKSSIVYKRLGTLSPKEETMNPDLSNAVNILNDVDEFKLFKNGLLQSISTPLSKDSEINKYFMDYYSDDERELLNFVLRCKRVPERNL